MYASVLKALFGEEICILSKEGDYNNYTTPSKRRRNGGGLHFPATDR